VKDDFTRAFARRYAWPAYNPHATAASRQGPGRERRADP
jgi:hypothetical protein